MSTLRQTSLTHFNKKRCDPQENSDEVVSVCTAEGWVESASKVKSVYIHVPFCEHKCHYCDFYSISQSDDQYAPFIEQLKLEIQYLSSQFSSIETIFIGGGTPTIFEESLFEELLQVVSSQLPIASEYEWTIEANPESVTADKAMMMAQYGVNRVSIGAQSFHRELLLQLERIHKIENVERSITHFRQAGLNNINLDVMYAIPGQTPKQLVEDLERAIELQPKHLSCYSLVYEPNTPLETKLRNGNIQRVDQEVEAEMFLCVQETLKSHSFLQYEISNFAKNGFECKHNVAYWNNDDWWPFGPSASGHIDGIRWKNIPRISQYINGMPLPDIIDVETLPFDQQVGETFMLGLRMMKGIERSKVDALLESSNNTWRTSVINEYVSNGLLRWQDDYLALSPRGVLLADTVISALLMEDETIADTE